MGLDDNDFKIIILYFCHCVSARDNKYAHQRDQLQNRKDESADQLFFVGMEYFTLMRYDMHSTSKRLLEKMNLSNLF